MLTPITHNRRRVLGAAAATLAAGGLVLAGAAELRSSTPPTGVHPMSDRVLEGTSSRLGNLFRSIVHHLPGDSGELPVEGQLPSFAGATGWLNSEPADTGGAAGPGRPRRLLDLHLRQLAAHAALRPRLGCEVRGPGADHDRRPHAGVRLRARRRQHRRPGRRAGRAVPDRRRQRLRRLERLRQPLLAGGLHRRCAGPDPLPPLRRGRVRDAGDGHPAAAAGGRRGGRGPGSGRPWTRWGSKWRPTTRPCAPRRPTWGTARRPGWPRRTASGPMSRTTTPRHRACASTSGRRRAAGRSRGAPPRRRRRTPGSPSASRLAM